MGHCRGAFLASLIGAIVVVSGVGYADEFSSADLDEQKAWLGVRIKTGTHGVFVQEVIPRTPAADAGLRNGDQLMEVDGLQTRHPHELTSVIQSRSVGDRVALRVWRNGARHHLSAVLSRYLTEEEVLARRLVDTVAPPLELEVVTGGEGVSSLASLRGDVVIVEFFTTLCVSCTTTYSQLSELANRHRAEGLVVLGVSQDRKNSIAALARDAHIEFPLLRDPNGAAKRAWGDTGSVAPVFFVIDRDGVIRFAGTGTKRLRKAVEVAEQALRERNGLRLAGSAPAVP